MLHGLTELADIQVQLQRSRYLAIEDVGLNDHIDCRVGDLLLNITRWPERLGNQLSLSLVQCPVPYCNYQHPPTTL